MAWSRSGDKPLLEPMMVSLLMYICIYASLGLNDLSILFRGTTLPGCSVWNRAYASQSSCSKSHINSIPSYLVFYAIWGVKTYSINLYSPYFSLNNESQKLSYILDLRCPPETIRYDCKFIEYIYIYIRRERFAL